MSIINSAKASGLRKSVTHRNRQSQGYQIFDVDRNQQLNVSELRITMEQNHDVHLNEAAIIEMLDTLGVDRDHDHELSKSELLDFSPSLFENYIEQQLLPDKPWKHSRMSKQAWRYHPDDYTEVLSRVHRRLTDLLAAHHMPRFIANDSHTRQVVMYGAHGKYNAHYDSHDVSAETKAQPCCLVLPAHRKHAPCKSCRFMTVLYYLSDDVRGGDTVFPLANAYYRGKRFNEAGKEGAERFESLRWRMGGHNLPEVYCDAGAGGLKVKAERGKALIWFNHLLDAETQWMGEQDVYSMHAGCPVASGEKWIANHWILVDAVPPTSVD